MNFLSLFQRRALKGPSPNIQLLNAADGVLHGQPLTFLPEKNYKLESLWKTLTPWSWVEAHYWLGLLSPLGAKDAHKFVESTQNDFVLLALYFSSMLCVHRCSAPPKCWQGSWTWKAFEFGPSNVGNLQGLSWRTFLIVIPLSRSPLTDGPAISKNGDLEGVLGVVYNTWPLIHLIF